jgi:hypothetical protein
MSCINSSAIIYLFVQLQKCLRIKIKSRREVRRQFEFMGCKRERNSDIKRCRKCLLHEFFWAECQNNSRVRLFSTLLFINYLSLARMSVFSPRKAERRVKVRRKKLNRPWIENVCVCMHETNANVSIFSRIAISVLGFCIILIFDTLK